MSTQKVLKTLGISPVGSETSNVLKKVLLESRPARRKVRQDFLSGKITMEEMRQKIREILTNMGAKME